MNKKILSITALCLIFSTATLVYATANHSHLHEHDTHLHEHGNITAPLSDQDGKTVSINPLTGCHYSDILINDECAHDINGVVDSTYCSRFPRRCHQPNVPKPAPGGFFIRN